MASKRITKSAVDWAAFAARVPEAQKGNFQLLKSRSDGYLRKMMSYPESPAAIDWAYYKSKITVPGLVEEFQKNYTNLRIPYPSDNLTSQVNDQEKATQIEIKQFIGKSEAQIEEHKKELAKLNSIMPFEEMTMEDYYDAYPDQAIDTINRPTFFPHDEPVPEGFVAPKLKDH